MDSLPSQSLRLVRPLRHRSAPHTLRSLHRTQKSPRRQLPPRH